MKTNQWKIDDIDETQEAIFQRDQLMRVREFLVEHEAEQELIGSIDEALEDIERWISPAIEAALASGALQSGES
jgi:hypothetical protein